MSTLQSTQPQRSRIRRRPPRRPRRRIPALDITGQAIAAAAAHRLIVYPASSCADGTTGDAFIVAPPLTATDEELDELLARLRATLVSLRALFPR
jgi:hypothetical protein